MRIRKSAPLIVLACSGLALASCASHEDATDSAATSTITESNTVTQTSTASVSPAESRSQGEGNPEETGECAQVANPLTNVRSLSEAEGGQEFAVSIMEDHFDPCAPLSWSIVGANSGTGSSIRQGVVFFTSGQVVTDPLPLFQETVKSVAPQDSRTATVTYEVVDGPRAAGKTTTHSATFQVEKPGTLKVIQNDLPPRANEAGVQLRTDQL